MRRDWSVADEHDAFRLNIFTPDDIGPNEKLPILVRPSSVTRADTGSPSCDRYGSSEEIFDPSEVRLTLQAAEAGSSPAFRPTGSTILHPSSVERQQRGVASSSSLPTTGSTCSDSWPPETWSRSTLTASPATMVRPYRCASFSRVTIGQASTTASPFSNGYVAISSPVNVAHLQTGARQHCQLRWRSGQRSHVRRERR